MTTFSQTQKKGKETMLKWKIHQYDILQRLRNNFDLENIDTHKIFEKFEILCDKLNRYPTFREFLDFIDDSILKTYAPLVNPNMLSSVAKLSGAGVFPESYGTNFFKSTKDIRSKHPGITEIPEGAWNDWNQDKLAKHFVNVALKKGRAPISKSIWNIARWNSKRDKKLSDKAKQVFEIYDALLSKKEK
jgi:hypothetical protein